MGLGFGGLSAMLGGILAIFGPLPLFPFHVPFSLACDSPPERDSTHATKASIRTRKSTSVPPEHPCSARFASARLSEARTFSHSC